MPDSSESIDAQLWGKEDGLDHPYPVICHLLDTATVAGAVWDALVPGKTAKRWAADIGMTISQLRSLFMFWAGLHDIGKISPAFQVMLTSRYVGLVNKHGYADASAGRKLRHDEVAHWILPQLLEEFGYQFDADAPDDSMAHKVAQMLGGHHGLFYLELESSEARRPLSYQPACGDGRWERQRRAHVEVLRDFTAAKEVPEQDLPMGMVVQWCGLIILSDWLASQSKVVESRLPDAGWIATPENLRRHWARACTDAPTVVSEAGLGSARLALKEFREAFRDIEEPNPLQKSIATTLPGLVDGPGLVLITAPPGDGKTEAGLFATAVMANACDAHGCYLALPTMATADSLFDRLRQFVAANAAGVQAVTRAHSMAFINDAEKPVADGLVITDDVTVPARWLYGRHRPMWARFTSGTIDQPLASVLPSRYNVLRLASLAGKVLVVDEAHSYGPWMHRLLERLLEWCAHMGVPVVLMSATLTGRTAASLVAAYRRGAGHFDTVDLPSMYPGWIYVNGSSGKVSDPHPVASTRPRHLAVDMRPVFANSPTSRMSVITDLLAPVAQEGGCAMVVCATVAEAQATYDAVLNWAENTDIDVHLLHARFPAWRRHEITTEVERLFGKKQPMKPRPPSILIATSIVEQSVDLDFDLVVSDLAPLALLFQRAGRCQRHELVRPSWAGKDPRLVVLDPVNSDGELSVPKSWGKLYYSGLLRRTRALLHSRGTNPISIPEDVQSLVDEVYADDFGAGLSEAIRAELTEWKATLDEEDLERLGDELAQQLLADQVAIPAPHNVLDLAELSGLGGAGPVDEDLLTTRLGADSVRAVCLYTQPDGLHTLDPEGSIPVPGADDDLHHDDLKTLLQHTIPVPAAWVRGIESIAPPSWTKRAQARDILPLAMHPSQHGWSHTTGPRLLHIDAACRRGLSQET